MHSDASICAQASILGRLPFRHSFILSVLYLKSKVFNIFFLPIKLPAQNHAHKRRSLSERRGGNLGECRRLASVEIEDSYVSFIINYDIPQVAVIVLKIICFGF